MLWVSRCHSRMVCRSRAVANRSRCRSVLGTHDNHILDVTRASFQPSGRDVAVRCARLDGPLNKWALHGRRHPSRRPRSHPPHPHRRLHPPSRPRRFPLRQWVAADRPVEGVQSVDPTHGPVGPCHCRRRPSTPPKTLILTWAWRRRTKPESGTPKAPKVSKS